MQILLQKQIESKLYTKKDFNVTNQSNLSENIVAALGGIGNITDIGCCATRLRISVSDPSKVNKDSLKSTKASGVLVSGNGVQVIYGPKVTIIKSELEEYVNSLRNSDG